MRPLKVITTANLSIEIYNQLEEYSKKGYTKTYIIEQALKEYFEKQKA